MVRTPVLGLLAAVLLGAPAAASDVEMRRREGHPRARFPLAVHVMPAADPRLEAAVRRAVTDWNAVTQATLGLAAFALVPHPTDAAILVALGTRASPKLMGETEISADPAGVIALPVRITLVEPTARGQTVPETVLFEVAAHELGHALGLPHTGDPRSIMCCIRGSIDFTDPAVRSAYIEARRHPDLRSVEGQLRAHYEAFWKD